MDMTTLLRVFLSVAIFVTQWVIIPDGHLLRPDSEVWATLFYGSLLAFTSSGIFLALIPDSEATRYFWRASFVIYLGTLGSTCFRAPDVTLFLLITSLPSLLLRMMLRKSTIPAEHKLEDC